MKRPVVRITGSHKHSCIFGAIISMEDKQLFRQYDIYSMEIPFWVPEDNPLLVSKCYLFMDKAALLISSQRR